MRTSSEKISKYLKDQIIKTFIQVISDFRDEEKTKKFLYDFLTESEIGNFSRRLAIAYWLKKGRSYTNIKNNLKASSATIAEVSVMMKRDGFEQAIKKMEAEEWASIWAERIKKAWPRKIEERFFNTQK
jgi:uncharacterized protein YerC